MPPIPFLSPAFFAEAGFRIVDIGMVRARGKNKSADTLTNFRRRNSNSLRRSTKSDKHGGRTLYFLRERTRVFPANYPLPMKSHSQGFSVEGWGRLGRPRTGHEEEKRLWRASEGPCAGHNRLTHPTTSFLLRQVEKLTLNVTL